MPTANGIAVYAAITRTVNENSVMLRGRRPLFTASDDGRRFTATWKIDHRLRLTRTFTYSRGETPQLVTTNRLLTSRGELLGVSEERTAGLSRYQQQTFVDHVTLQLAFTARDVQVRGLLHLADKEPTPRRAAV